MAESEEELKSLSMRVKEESEKAGLKLNIQEKLRSWRLVPSLHGTKEGKKEEMTDFIFLGAPKTLGTVTAAMKLKGTCLLEGEL